MCTQPSNHDAIESAPIVSSVINKPTTDPTGRAYSGPADPPAVLRGPTSKGRGGEGTEGEGRREEERRGKGGSSSFALGTHTHTHIRLTALCPGLPG